MIPLSTLLIKKSSSKPDGLYRELDLYLPTEKLKYSLTMYNPSNGFILVNKNLHSGSQVSNYIKSFDSDIKVHGVEIVVSREIVAAEDKDFIAVQPFIQGEYVHSLDHKTPVYFTAGYAKSTSGIFLTSRQRDIILDAATKNASYIQLQNEKATCYELFNTIKHILSNGKPLSNCLVIGIYPAQNARRGAILYMNSDKLLYDKDLDIYYVGNNYSVDVKQIEMSWGLNHNKNNAVVKEPIKVVPEKTDLSQIAKEDDLPDFEKDDILQISFLSHNTASSFCQLYEATYVDPIGKRVCMRRAFGYPVDIVTMTFEEIEPLYIDVFKLKII